MVYNSGCYDSGAGAGDVGGSTSNAHVGVNAGEMLVMVEGGGGDDLVVMVMKVWNLW